MCDAIMAAKADKTMQCVALKGKQLMQNAENLLNFKTCHAKKGLMCNYAMQVFASLYP